MSLLDSLIMVAPIKVGDQLREGSINATAAASAGRME